MGRIRPAAEEPTDAGSSRIDVHLPPDADGVDPAASVAGLPLFRRLPDAVRAEIERTAGDRHLEAGEWLFTEGDPADALFVVRTGRLEVVVGGTVVRELGPGAVVGELALLADETRSAAVRARRDSRVAEVSRADFETAMSHDPGSYHAVASVLAEQLRSARPAVRARAAQPTVIAVLGLHAGAPVAEVAETLTRGLGEHLRVELLRKPDHESLERAEEDLDRVVVAAAVDDESWSFCLRQADHVVLVAESRQDVAAAGHVLRRPGRSGADLVLVGPRPSEDTLRDWCAALEPWQVTCAPGDLAVALRPLVARIAGRSVGVVMAGGGARAFAHIGVLQELEAAGIVVDRVAGCSVGAIVAGVYSTGVDAATVHDLCYAEFVRAQPFSDYTLPTVSLAKGKRTREGLRRHLGGRTIEALPRQFRCNSVDMMARDSVAHREGELSEAVIASVSLPVLFPPRPDGDRLLIDGGVLDNLPVGLLMERDEGPVVAVNIAMGGGGPKRSGPPRTPPLGDTLLRTMMIGSGGAVQTARESGAFVITPPPLGVGLLEFHQMDLMVEAGRMAAREMLDQAGGQFPASAQG